jgi:ATP-dependent Clp protease ATP-binding subunit ClpA
MIILPDLAGLLGAAAIRASAAGRPLFGLPELMLAVLDEQQDTLQELLEELLQGAEHRQALQQHFEQAAVAVAGQRASTGSADPAQPGDEEQAALRAAVLAALPGLPAAPDEALLSLLEGWQLQREGEALGAEEFFKLLLLNWSQLYPLPLSKLGIEIEEAEPAGESGGGQFLRSLFGPEQDLNRRWSEEPMLGLLDYADYKRAMMEVLVRRYRQNLLLYGPPGSGKSTVLRRLVEDTAAGRVPPIFAGKRFFEFSVELFTRGLADPRDLAHRFELLQGFLERHPEVVLVVDGVHHLLQTQNPVVQEVAQRLFRMLSLKRLHVALLADVSFYNQAIRSNPAFDEVLSPVYVRPLSRGDVLTILEQVKDRFEEQYGLPLARPQLEAVVEMADEHVKTIHFPKKALVLLDVALSILALDDRLSPPSWDDVLRIALGRITGRVQDDFPGLEERLDRLEEDLKARIIGQDEAIAEVCRTIRFVKSDLELNPDRPDGVFLFGGPAGVGKQLLAGELSRLVYGREAFVLELSEFQEAESLGLLQGRPQGEGFPSRSPLDPLREEPRRVFVLRNIEYAAGEVLNWFLKGFEDGYLSDWAGRRISVGDTTVVLLSDLVGYKQKSSFGFEAVGDGPPRLNTDQLREYFTPELLRSVDKLVVFQPLTEEDLLRILAERIVPAFRAKVARLGHELVVSRDVERLVARVGTALEYNARTVDRKFEELVAERVNEEIRLARGGSLQIRVELDQDQVRLSAQPMSAG